MKVMHINAVYGVGSTGVIVEDLHNLSFENGIDSYVSYSTSDRSPDEIRNGYVIGKNAGKKIHAALSRLGGKQAYFSRYATQKLIEHIKSVKPDIVHLHNLHSNFIHLNSLLEYLGNADIKTVITLHDCWFYTGGCFHYTFDNCFKWLDGCGNCPKKMKDTPAYISDNSAKILADRKKYFGKIKNLTVVGVSQWISDEAKRTFFKDRDVRTVYNGVDTHVYVDTESDFREKYNLQNKFLILAPASKWLKPINRETFDTVAENLPDDSVIVMLGCNSETGKNLPQNVLPLEFIKDRNELIKVYSACDVFANCTREESLSLINVEAQSCGTPVVTYRNTGAQETVDNKCGFSVESGNASEFLNAILKVREMGKPSFSKECHLWAEKRFDKKKNYDEYISLYKSR